MQNARVSTMIYKRARSPYENNETIFVKIFDAPG